MDPVHVAKNGKGYFMRGKLEVSEKYVKHFGLSSRFTNFEYVKQLVAYDETHEKQIAVHLNNKHLSYATHAQMDVKPMLAIFNFKTADAIDFLVKHENWPDAARTTAQVIRLWARFYQITCGCSREQAFDKKHPEKLQEKVSYLYFFMDFWSSTKLDEKQKNVWGNQKHVAVVCMTFVWVQERLLSQEEIDFFKGANLGGNSVENLHTDVRRINPVPTPQIYSRILKGIALTQLFGDEVKGSNYQVDEGKEFLVKMNDFKKLEEKNLEKELADQQFFEEADILTQGFAQKAVVSYIGGGVLCQIIKNCDVCLAFWTLEKEFSDNSLNALIDCKEFVPDALVRPTDIGHDILQYADDLFVKNRGNFEGDDGLVGSFTTFLIEKISERFGNIPGCHYEAIIKKLTFGKWCHYGKFLNRDLLELNRDEISSEANSSKSTKAKALLNPCTGPARSNSFGVGAEFKFVEEPLVDDNDDIDDFFAREDYDRGEDVEMVEGFDMASSETEAMPDFASADEYAAYLATDPK